MIRPTTYRLFFLALLLSIAGGLAAQTRVSTRPFVKPGFSQRNPKAHRDRSGHYFNDALGEYHMLGAWIDGAYSSTTCSMDNVHIKGGYGLGGGATYMWQKDYFLLQTGLGLRWQSSRLAVDAWSDTIPNKVDTQGHPYTLYYQFHDRTDRAGTFSLGVPLMVGGHYGGFVALAGLKMGWNISGYTDIQLQGSTAAYYDRWIGLPSSGLMEEMDNHGLRKDVPLHAHHKGTVWNGISLAACAEIGYDWSFQDYTRRRRYRQPYSHLRLAAFAEYVFAKFGTTAKGTFCTIPVQTPFDFATFEFDHVASTVSDTRFSDLYCGLRLTYFYGIPVQDKRVIQSGNHRRK